MYKSISFRASYSVSSCRFRRWSRKGYAIFCSLGEHVTIGCLRKNIAETALRKQPGTKAIALEGYESGIQAPSAKEEGETGGGRLFAADLSVTELLFLLQGSSAASNWSIRQVNQAQAELPKASASLTYFHFSSLLRELPFSNFSLKGLSIHKTFILSHRQEKGSLWRSFCYSRIRPQQKLYTYTLTVPFSSKFTLS